MKQKIQLRKDKNFTMVNSAFDNPAENTPSIKQRRIADNMGEKAKAEGDINGFKEMLGKQKGFMSDFVKGGAEGHPHPLFAVVWMIANYLSSAGEHEAARSLFRAIRFHFTEKANHVWKALINEGNECFKLGLFEDAFECTAQAWNEGPLDEGVLFNLLLILHALNQKEEVSQLLAEVPTLCNLKDPKGNFRLHIEHDPDWNLLKDYPEVKRCIEPELNH